MSKVFAILGGKLDYLIAIVGLISNWSAFDSFWTLVRHSSHILYSLRSLSSARLKHDNHNAEASRPKDSLSTSWIVSRSTSWEMSTSSTCTFRSSRRARVGRWRHCPQDLRTSLSWLNWALHSPVLILPVKSPWTWLLAYRSAILLVWYYQGICHLHL